MAISIYTSPEGQVSPGNILTIKVTGLTPSFSNSIIVYIDNVEYDNINADDQTSVIKMIAIPTNATSTVKIVAQSGIVKSTAYLDIISSSPDSGSSGPGSGGSTAAKPTIGLFTLTPINNSNVPQSYAIQNVTKIKATVSNCLAGSGSISYYVFSSPYETKTVNTNYGSAEVVFSAPLSSQTVSYSVTIYNSQGGYSTYTQTKAVYEYSAPYFITFDAYKTDESGKLDINGKCIMYKYDVNYSSINNTNAITVNIHCNDTIKSYTSKSGSGFILTNIDADTKYSVYASVYDTYGFSQNSYVVNIHPSGQILNISKDGDSMGIGGAAPSESGKFKCYWSAEFDGNVTLKGKLNNIDMLSWSPPKIQTGYFDITFDTYDKLQSKVVTFDSAFNKAPHITITPYIFWHEYAMYAINCYITNITALSFECSIWTEDASATIALGADSTIRCYWMAIA